MDKQTMVNPDDRVLFISTKKSAYKAKRRYGRPENHIAKWKNPTLTHYILYEFNFTGTWKSRTMETMMTSSWQGFRGKEGWIGWT